ncbi:MAG TPA: anti-sigma factor [Gemmataceae bacterium]|nr:anti-sigma factor [Gemmataceae bacterium]
MTCEELLKALNDYVDDEATLAVCREFADHLAGCNPCQVVVDNIRNTIRLYKAGKPYPMPAEFSARLRDALRARWEETRSGPGKRPGRE